MLSCRSTLSTLLKRNPIAAIIPTRTVSPTTSKPPLTTQIQQQYRMSSQFVDKKLTEKTKQSRKMYKTVNHLPEELRTKVVDMLQPTLADSLDIKTQIKQAHWNVKGPSFIGLHYLFDEIAEAAEEWVDNVAERLVQLGGVAEGTLRSCAARTTLPEYPLEISNGSDHVQALSNALASYNHACRQKARAVEDAGDQGTADVLDDICDSLAKWQWFVEAHLQAEK